MLRRDRNRSAPRQRGHGSGARRAPASPPPAAAGCRGMHAHQAGERHVHEEASTGASAAPGGDARGIRPRCWRCQPGTRFWGKARGGRPGRRARQACSPGLACSSRRLRGLTRGAEAGFADRARRPLPAGRASSGRHGRRPGSPPSCEAAEPVFGPPGVRPRWTGGSPHGGPGPPALPAARIVPGQLPTRW